MSEAEAIPGISILIASRYRGIVAEVQMRLKAMILVCSMIAGMWGVPAEAAEKGRKCGRDEYCPVYYQYCPVYYQYCPAYYECCPEYYQCCPVYECVPSQVCSVPAAICWVPSSAYAPAAAMDPLQSLQLEVGRLRLDHNALKK